MADYSSTKPSYNEIDFGQYLNRKIQGKKTRGVFFINIESSDKRVSDKRLILISDLGLTVKKDIQQNHDIFIQSLRSGEPISGATVEVIGSNGISLASKASSDRGHVFIPKITREDQFDPRPVGILVKLGSDMAYMKYDDYNLQLSYSKFDIGGRQNAQGKDAVSAFLFTDRGIYRPGEAGEIGFIAKSGNWSQNLSGIPVDLEIENSRGKTILREIRVLRKSGFDDFSFRLGRNSPTGSYTAKIYNFFDNSRKKNRRLIGSVNFKVEEFLPDRLKLNVHLSKQKNEGWVSPEDIKGHLNLQNLFGYPAAGNDVMARFKVEPLSLYFRKFQDYRFDNPSESFSTYTEVLSKKQTDDKGLADYEINIDKFANNIFRLSFMSEGFEKEGGRSVTARVSTLVSPHPYLIGIKAEGDFSYIGRDDEKEVKFIAVDSDVNSIDVNNLKYTIYEYQYVNVLTKRPNGTYGYESVRKEEVVEKKPFSIAKDGSIFKLDTSKAGEFKIEISGENGIKLSRLGYSIIGEQNLARSLGRNAELQVKLNKKDFLPGENIELEIKGPFRGAGLITIERDKVYSFKWFKQTSETSIQKISVPKDLEGNAYVNISLVRGRNSKQIYMSPLSYGVFPFTVNKDSKRENIKIEVAGLAKPGDMLPIKYSTTHNSEIMLYAINEGILQFAKYSNPKPLDYFFAKKSLATKTYQLLDQLLPEFSLVKDLLAPGGGFGSMSDHLNPFNRKLKKPVAFWSGVLKSGPGQKTWSVPIPGHFNGGLRILAVAVGQELSWERGQENVCKSGYYLNSKCSDLR